MRKREAIQPRNLVNVEADALPMAAGRKIRALSESGEIPPGSKSVASAQGSTRIPGRSDRLHESGKGN